MSVGDARQTADAQMAIVGLTVLETCVWKLLVCKWKQQPITWKYLSRELFFGFFFK